LETILTLNKLTKHYGAVRAVNDLSFTIEKGNVYGILGPNGSGKSTTLGMVLNVVNATNGDYYSLGMKQRLAIASALLNDPEILILDEPTNGLDPQGIHQIREIIKKIAASGTTILLASHLLDEVEKVCSHVVILRKGVKLYSGRVDAMNASHGFFELKCDDTEKLVNYLNNNPLFGEVKTEGDLVTGFLKNPLSAKELNNQLHAQDIILSHLVQRKESLEEQFLQLTNNLN